MGRLGTALLSSGFVELGWSTNYWLEWCGARDKDHVDAQVVLAIDGGAQQHALTLDCSLFSHGANLGGVIVAVFDKQDDRALAGDSQEGQEW